MPVKVTIRAELQDAEAGPEVQKIGLSFKSLPPEPVVVQTVAPATWGSDRGIQGGQQIVAINGVDVATMTQQEFRAALKARPLTLRFRISDDPEEEPLQAAVAGSDVDKLGMSFQSLPPEPVIVNKVAAGLWAESVGFLGGEEILVVNGESTVAMSSEDLKAALRVRPLVLRFQQPAEEEEEDEQDDLVQEVEVGPEVSKIGLSFHNLPPEPVVVNKVAAGTWAESVGFIGGEEILALNDEDVASMTSERFKSVLKSRPLLIRFQASEFEEVEAGEEVVKIGLSFKALPPEPLVVSKVAPGSWAATVGFQGGEEIAAINGIAVADMSNEDFKALLRARPLTLRIVSSTVAVAEPPAGQTDKDARDKQQAQAATKIQAIHRGNLARKEGQAKRKRKAAKEAKEGEAATKIQAIRRGNLARKEAQSQREEEDRRGKDKENAAKEAQSKQEEEAATKIQAIHRGNLARKDGRSKQPEKAAKEAQSKQEEDAATKIQAIHRGNLARKDGRSKQPEKAAKVAPNKQEEEAATKIQAIHRGNLARKDGRSKQPDQATKESQSKQEEEAATKIQAIHRGNLARKDGRSKQPDQATKEEREKVAQAAQSKREEEAATKIQAIHRGNLARKDGRGSKKQNAAEGEERAARSSKGSRSLRASIVDMAGPKHSAERASRTRRRAETAKSSRSGSAGHSPRRSRSSQGSESDRSPSAGRDPAAKLYAMPSSLATPATPVSWLVEEFGGATSSRATTPSPRPVSPKRSASAPNSARVRPNSGAALRQFRAELLRREGTFAAGWRRILDSSATGFVTHAEFCEACRRMNYRGNIRDAWHELDADGSGKATICELDWPTAEALGKFTSALASRFGGVDQAAKSWGLRGGRRLRKEEFRSLVSGILEPREADSIFRMICCHDTLARPSVRAEDLRWLQQLSPSLPRVAANRVEPGMLAAEQPNDPGLTFQTPGEVPSEAVGDPPGPVAPLEPGETSPRTPRTPRSASQPLPKHQEADEGFARLTREDLYNRLYREAKDFHKRKQEKHEKEGLFKKPEPNLSAAQTGSTAYFKRLYNKGLLQKAQQEERRQRLEREADEHFRKPRQPRRDVPSWLHKANPELSAKLQEPVWTRLQKPREPKKEEPTPVVTPRHLTVESVSTAACRADVAAAAADRLYSQAQKRKERQRKKKDAEDGLQTIKEKKEKEVKLTKERQNDLVLRLHNYGQEKQKEAMEKREEARKAAEEEVRQLADRRRGKGNKVRPETFFRLHLDGLQREEALAERRKMKEMEEEHRLKAESIHCGAAPNPDVFHMLHTSYNAKQGRVVSKTAEAEEDEAEAASEEGSEHFDTEVEQANLDLSAWKLSHQGPRSPDDAGDEAEADPREPSDRRRSNEEDRASTLQELREVRRSRLAMNDWMETQKRELKAGDDRFRTPPGASIAPGERPADSPSLEGGPEGDERALQALLQRRPGSVPGGKRRSVAATLLSKELFGSDDEKDEPLPSQSSHDADPLWGAVSDIVSWKRKDEAT